jgi:hypothetical protein
VGLGPAGLRPDASGRNPNRQSESPWNRTIEKTLEGFKEAGGEPGEKQLTFGRRWAGPVDIARSTFETD